MSNVLLLFKEMNWAGEKFDSLHYCIRHKLITFPRERNQLINRAKVEQFVTQVQYILLKTVFRIVLYILYKYINRRTIEIPLDTHILKAQLLF